MKKKSGFTVIEVVLVLGIAGLIMVMVFVALPSLWTSQRDADRRANVMNFISALKTYQTNNSRGALPDGTELTCTLSYPVKCNPKNDSWTNFLQQYYTKGHALEDPSGSQPYLVKVSDCGASTGVGESCETKTTIESSSFDPDASTIYVIKSATCDEEGDDIVIKTANNRSVAAVQVLEKGRYCHNT